MLVAKRKANERRRRNSACSCGRGRARQAKVGSFCWEDGVGEVLGSEAEISSGVGRNQSSVTFDEKANI